MRVAIVGGTGTAGRALARELTGRGHTVRLLSRRPPARPSPGAEEARPGVATEVGSAEHVRADVASGEGLAEGLRGVDAVVQAVDARRDVERVLVGGSQRLAAAGAEAGVGHLVGLSVVGCDRTPMGYYRVKAEQERVIEGAGVPWSVLRSTQFHGLLAWVFASAARARVVPAGRLPLQPVAVRDVAAALADLVEAGPSGRASIAGPQIERLGDLARTWRESTGTRAQPLPVPLVTPTLRAVARGTLCDPAAPRGSVTFADWLARR